jgi:hypothetical protein
VADSLFSILSDKDFSEPQETVAIKKYVHGHYQVTVEAIIRGSDIIVTAPSAALTSTLRFNTSQLKKVAQTDKRIVFRTR